jgi:hypothetical protein
MSGANLMTVTHTYAAGPPAIVSATLSVVNHLAIASLPVQATLYPNDPPPTATIWLRNTTAPTRSRYYAGDVWAFGTSDARDGSGHSLPPGNLTWEVHFQHQHHWHPFLSGIIGTQGLFTPSATTETDPVQWYRPILTMRDSLGQVATIYRDVLPATTTVTLNTSPSGGRVTFVGWGTNVGPWAMTRVVNMDIGIGVASLQQIGGQNYVFDLWSNCGGQSQIIVVPPGGAAYTALLSLSGSSVTTTLRSAMPIETRTATTAVGTLQCRRLYLPFVVH